VRRHQFIYILLALSLVSVVGFRWAWKKSPRVSCYPQGFVASSNGEKQYAYPEKIVVKPWRGRHHVYGVFMIPKASKNDQLVTVTVSENKTYCGQMMNFSAASDEDIDTKPGYHLMKGYINTRVALYLIIKGKIDQMKQPSNWKLGYVDKK
jgi:hypothetical protein